MKQRTFNQSLAGIGALILGVGVWAVLAMDPAGKDEASSAAPEAVHKKSERGGNESDPQSSPDETRRHKFRDLANGKLVRLTPGQVLATVNSKPIEAKHLVPILKGETEDVLTREEYSSRLQRAVDVEIILQAASAEKVELTEAQKVRVDGIAEGNEAEMDHYKQYGLSWKSTGKEHEEFEKRLLNAQLLEQNLVAMKSEVGPSTDPEIQALYEQARVELLAQLHEQAEIAIVAPAAGR